MAKSPNGPSIKFYCTNVHTMDELRLTGNCLKGSRALLVFDKKFNDSIEFKVMKEVITQVWLCVCMSFIYGNLFLFLFFFLICLKTIPQKIRDLWEKKLKDTNKT